MAQTIHCSKMACPICHVLTWHVLTKDGVWECLECKLLEGGEVAIVLSDGRVVPS